MLPTFSPPIGARVILIPNCIVYRIELILPRQRYYLVYDDVFYDNQREYCVDSSRFMYCGPDYEISVGLEKIRDSDEWLDTFRVMWEKDHNVPTGSTTIWRRRISK